MKFYKCGKCGNTFEVIVDAAIVPVCCDTHMNILNSNTDEKGSKEKHIPVYTKEKNKVTVWVGSIIHPSEEDHYIEWISLETSSGRYKKYLKPGEAPRVTFFLSDEKEDVINIYAYCNVHGLWSLN